MKTARILTAAILFASFLPSPCLSQSEQSGKLQLRPLVVSALRSRSCTDAKTVQALSGISFDVSHPAIGLSRVRIGQVKKITMAAKTFDAAGSRVESKPTLTFDTEIWIRRQHLSQFVSGVGGLFESDTNQGQCVLFIPLTKLPAGGNKKLTREYEIQATFKAGNISNYRLKLLKHSAPSAIDSAIQCSANSPSSTQKSLAPASNVTSQTTLPLAASARTLVLSIDSDSRFFSFYKGKTANIIAVVLQRVNQIYSSQFGISLRLASLTIHASKADDPFAANFTSSNDLLDNYTAFVTQFPVPNTDTNHLFTGKRGFLDAIGLSWIGAVCGFPDSRAAWSEYAQGFFWFSETVAHEIGHNLGANHDLNDIHSIMSVAGKANLKNPYFSAFSISEIETNLTTAGACLDDSAGSDLPIPGSVKFPPADENPKNILVSISIKRAKNSATISGVVKTIQGKALSGRVVQIVAFDTNTILATTLTKSGGKYSFKVSHRGRYFVDDRIGQKGSVLVKF
jgi:hypothetical protein